MALHLFLHLLEHHVSSLLQGLQGSQEWMWKNNPTGSEFMFLFVTSNLLSFTCFFRGWVNSYISLVCRCLSEIGCMQKCLVMNTELEVVLPNARYAGRVHGNVDLIMKLMHGRVLLYRFLSHVLSFIVSWVINILTYAPSLTL